MADVFERRAELKAYRKRLWDVIYQTPYLDWLLLTKRPQNINSMISWSHYDWPENIWIGVTVENQHWADKRLPILAQTGAKIKFLSCEPLLGQIQEFQSNYPKGTTFAQLCQDKINDTIANTSLLSDTLVDLAKSGEFNTRLETTSLRVSISFPSNFSRAGTINLVRIWEQHIQQNPGTEKLPPIIPVVLAQDNKEWKVPTQFSELLEIPETIKDSVNDFLPSFSYRLIELANIPYERIEGTPVGIMSLRVLRAASFHELLNDKVWDEGVQF